MGSCLSDGLAEGLRQGPLPGLHELQISPALDFYVWGFVKDNIYIVSMYITLTNLKEQI
jgi:hypothetical protein